MVKTKIAVLVSGGGTNLQALLDAQAAGKLPHGKIALVVSNNPNAYALTRAGEAGVNTAVITGEQFEERLQEVLQSAGIDMIVLAGFMKILSGDFTARGPERILNIHPALIPSFCGEGYYGLKVHEAALRYGVKITGATVHYVNEVPDGGRIIAQKAVEVREGDTPEVLQRRVMEQAEWILLPQAVEKVAETLSQGK